MARREDHHDERNALQRAPLTHAIHGERAQFRFGLRGDDGTTKATKRGRIGRRKGVEFRESAASSVGADTTAAHGIPEALRTDGALRLRRRRHDQGGQ